MFVSAIHKWHDLSVAIGNSRAGAGGNADTDTDTASHSGGGDTRGDTAGSERLAFTGKEVKRF
jgi:hypothetical protein